MKRIFITCTATVLLTACGKRATTDNGAHEQLRQLNVALTEAEINDDVKTFISHYDATAISMPEYQSTVEGLDQIESFYSEMFKRQQVISFQRNPEEYIDLDSTIAEFGTFHKKYTMAASDSVITQDGKYCFVWRKSPGGRFSLRAETYGFFHPVNDPETLVVREVTPETYEAYNEEMIPFELRAYNALMEKYVSRSGSGALRAEFFTEDGKFFPFAHPAVSGMNNIKPYLIKYGTHGPGFQFDTISVWTFRYEYHEPYVLEIPKFFVQWSTPGATGGASGQGIRIWKRQPDHSLKLYREIGTHNLD